MSAQILSAFVTFAFVSSVTPGPNNLMLMASGANFGLRRTLPHMLGIGIGFAVMVAMVGAGLMQVFESYPVLYRLLKTGAVLYLLWLAWKIATAAAPGTADGGGGRPLSFLQAAAFQWVNPKAWAMALTAISVYAPAGDLWSVALIAMIFGLVNLPSVSLWALLGRQIGALLGRPAHLRAFNALLAILLVGSLYPILFS